MHSITAQTPFSRLWPQRRLTQSGADSPQPAPTETRPPPAADHDFLVLTCRPDLLPVAPASLDSIDSHHG